MASQPHLTLQVPEPSVRPGGRPDFTHVGVPRRAKRRALPIDVDPAEIRDLAYSIIRVLDDNGEAVGPWAGALTDDELREGLRDMMMTRAFDARMLIVAAPGQDLVLYAAHGRRGGRCAHRKALEPGDMNFPTYRQQGPADRGGWPLVDMMNQIFSNEKDRLKGRQLPVSIRPRRPASSRSPAISARNIPGGRLGDGLGDQEATRTSPRAGSATARPPNPTSMPRWCSPRLPAAGRPQHRQQPVGDLDLPGHRRRRERQFRRARATASAFRRCASTATTISRSTPPRNGRSSGRARNLGPTLIECVTYRVGAHSTSDDPSHIPAEGRMADLAARRSRSRLKNHLIAAAPGARSATSRCGPRSTRRCWRRRKEAESHGTLHAGRKPSRATCSRASTRRCRAHLREQRQQPGV